jgi:hypothetical protein
MFAECVGGVGFVIYCLCYEKFLPSSLSLSLSRIATISLAIAILLGGVWLFNFNSPDSLALSVDSISPTSGSPDGGETVTISGSGFQVLTPNSPINFGYTNGYQSYTTTTNGIYQLEVWGGQGANYSIAGGKGGYSVGSVYLTAGTDLIVGVGGAGSGATGGFNGGGNGNGAGGGGASDIRIGAGTDNDGDGRFARVIVAGGGSGSPAILSGSGSSGTGGGLNGGGGYSSLLGCTSVGASQISGVGGGCTVVNNGQFGKGGSATVGVGGGGGWYGGSNTSTGAGGSGWIYTESTYNYWAVNSPEGLSGQWKLTPAYYLTNASTSNGVNTGNGRATISPMLEQTPEVLFDGEPAVNCVVISDTEMTCQTPAHAAGTVPVTVDGVSAGEYEYLVPTFLNLTTDKSELNMSGLPNVLIADYLTANVITNNSTGYHLDIEATEPRLTCSSYDTNYYIEPLASAETGTMLDNKWGYAVDSAIAPTEPSIWTGLTTSPTVFDNYTTATDLTLGQNTRLWFGTKVNMSLPACSYGGSVTITAIANGSV